MASLGKISPESQDLSVPFGGQEWARTDSNGDPISYDPDTGLFYGVDSETDLAIKHAYEDRRLRALYVQDKLAANREQQRQRAKESSLQLQQSEQSCNTLLQLVRDYTGTLVDPEKWQQGQAHDCRLREQSSEIARMLEKAGFDPYTDRPGLTLLGLCTGLTKELPSYKDLNFIPVVAKRKRNRMLQEASAYFDMECETSIVRMWTFTQGVRFPMFDGVAGREDFRRRWAEFHKRLNRLSAYLRKTWAIEFLYRGTELAGSKNGFLPDERGRPTFHLHSHVAVRLHKKLSPSDWNLMLRDVGSRWGDVWDEGGRLENPRELIKYVCKPADLLALLPDQLAQMMECTKGLSFARPLGSLREWRKSLKDDKLRVTQLGGAWRTVPDWNASDNCACAVSDGKPRPRIVALTQPAPVFAPMREPCAIVMNWDGVKPIEYTPFQLQVGEHALRVHTTSIIDKQSNPTPSGTENEQQIAQFPPGSNPY